MYDDKCVSCYTFYVLCYISDFIKLHLDRLNCISDTRSCTRDGIRLKAKFEASSSKIELSAKEKINTYNGLCSIDVLHFGDSAISLVKISICLLMYVHTLSFLSPDIPNAVFAPHVPRTQTN